MTDLFAYFLLDYWKNYHILTKYTIWYIVIITFSYLVSVYSWQPSDISSSKRLNSKLPSITTAKIAELMIY